MNPERLLAYFDRVSEAPDALPRLRRFILDVAVRGKLVEQDPRDGATRAISENAEGVPFDVPESWTWARVGGVAQCRLGKMLDKAKNKGSPRRYLRNINVRWFDFDLSNALRMPFEDSELEEFSLRSGDVLICEGGEPGRAAVWDEREADIYFQKAVHRVRFSGAVDPQFFVNVLRSSADDGRLATYFTGVGIKHFTGKGLASFLFPLPPLGEQRRIIAKVGELMALCDQLEAAQAERKRRRDQVAVASLHRLDQPADEATEFRAHAEFHLRHLPRLATRPEHVQRLRQTILTLAVCGRLVPQDPSDEPAHRLLGLILAENASLEVGKRTRAPTPATAVGESQALFPLPSGWCWSRIGEVCSSVTDGDHLPPPKAEAGVPFLVIGNVRNRTISFVGCRYVSEKYYRALDPIRRPRRGDVLYTLVGSFGIPVFVDGDRQFCVQRHIGILRPSSHLNAWFLVRALQSRFLLDQATDCATGIAQKTVPLSGLRRMAVPLPPLAEQHRIVAKVDELMAVCDQLEAQLTAAQTESRRLLEAVLHEALAAAA